MKRKVTLTISAVLIAFDIGISAALYAAGERRASAVVTTINAAVDIVREYARPYPTL